MSAPACMRCSPRSVVPIANAAGRMGIVEPYKGCACLFDCGEQGCTGEPQPVVDKPTRGHVRQKET